MKKFAGIVICLCLTFACFSCGNAQSVSVQTHTVTFVCDGRTQTVTCGDTLDRIDAFTEQNVLGWTADPAHKYRTVELPLAVGEDITLYAVRQSDFESYFPVLDIKTKGEIKDKENYVEARISLYNTDAEYAFSSAKAGIRLRGNSTMYYDKKPYRIKFDEKKSMLGEPAHKSWVLLADYLDASLMKNKAAFYFAGGLSGLEFTSCAHHVEVKLNGVYQGVYLLCDQIQEQKNTRVPIEVKELGERRIPFLIEKDYRAESESETEYDWFAFGEHTYAIKYPENLTKLQYDYIVEYYSRLETAVKENDLDTVRAHVDMNSLYDFYIVNEMFFNRDALFTSCYMYKTTDGKLKFGPVWDFDWTLDTPWTGKPTVHNDTASAALPYFTEYNPEHDDEPGWWCWLMDLLQDKTCKAEFAARWQLARGAALDTIREIKEYRKALIPAAERNSALWYCDYESGGKEGYEPQNESLFFDQYAFLTDFLSLRVTYFDRYCSE